MPSRGDLPRAFHCWLISAMLLVAGASHAAGPWFGVTGFLPSEGEIPTNAVVYVTATGLFAADLEGTITVTESGIDGGPHADAGSLAVEGLEDVPCGPNYLDYESDCLIRLELGGLTAGSSIVVTAVSNLWEGNVVGYTVGAGSDTSPPTVAGVQASAYYKAGGVTGSGCDRWITPHFSVVLEPNAYDDDRVIAYAVLSHPENAVIRVSALPRIQEPSVSGERCYRVVAIDAGGNQSAPSEPVCIELTVPPDAEPTPSWCDDEPPADEDDAPPADDEGPTDGGPSGEQGGAVDGGAVDDGAVDGGGSDAADETDGGCMQASGAERSTFAAFGLFLLVIAGGRRRSR